MISVFDLSTGRKLKNGYFLHQSESAVSTHPSCINRTDEEMRVWEFGVGEEGGGEGELGSRGAVDSVTDNPTPQPDILTQSSVYCPDNPPPQPDGLTESSVYCPDSHCEQSFEESFYCKFNGLHIALSGALPLKQWKNSQIVAYLSALEVFSDGLERSTII
ncbi:hypothetical protein RRG08_004888 [Elysia crispata]|uniref:Uncharacterized protein n=1 Tax=Elysia crispata TaxID=231223 RepID=A0AAE1DGF7_9GAST|nr:hypothetical protein RRG08_004888 [Elysia crispata]